MSLLTKKKMSFETQIFDSKINRRIDENGRLIVDKSLITKATVNQYLGKEIPNYQKYGLDANKLYNVLRPKEELEKCIDKFNMLPLLSKHIMDYAQIPQRDSWSGCVSNAYMENDGVYGSLSVWDNTEIQNIQSETKRDLSLGYNAKYVKESGIYNGVPYELVMRDIMPNHLALVKRGRVKGAEVFDENKNQGDGKMDKILKLLKEFTGFFDENPDELKKVEEVKDTEGQIAKLKEILIEKLGAEKADEIFNLLKMKDEKLPEPKPANEPAPKDGCTQDELNEAVKKAREEAIAETRKQYLEIERAKEDTKSVIGNVGVLDSADEYYKLGCQSLGIETKDMDSSKFKDVFIGAKVVMNKNQAKTVVMDESVATSSQKKIDEILSKTAKRK